jgi:hypothetical protein
LYSVWLELFKILISGKLGPMERFAEMKEKQIIGAKEKSSRGGSKNKKGGNPVHIRG